MLPAEARRYKDATLAELNGLKRKCITTLPRSAMPKDEKLYNASVMWTKCRSCFAGHTFDKDHADCYAPVAKFIYVLIILCLSAMYGWCLTGLDFEMAYLNADLDVPCYGYMRALTCVKECDEDGNELHWKCTSCMHGTAIQQAALFGLTCWLSVYELMVSLSFLLTNAFSPFGTTIRLLPLWLQTLTTARWPAILKRVVARSELNFYRCFLEKISVGLMLFVACRSTTRKLACEFPSSIT
jgi:hypothetical protein